uniref:Basement membrane-specific heparan sulfate proteoglycan core protein-like n=1 Tax=Petromyzon marinus TaxID=7757 RepID=A0AAJ7TPH6_PETMA|nr:basement membrane-specific heparan sulfate proteoglycan core protein-like [Petromyzon marinus]
MNATRSAVRRGGVELMAAMMAVVMTVMMTLGSHFFVQLLLLLVNTASAQQQHLWVRPGDKATLPCGGGLGEGSPFLTQWRRQSADGSWSVIAARSSGDSTPPPSWFSWGEGGSMELLAVEAARDSGSYLCFVLSRADSIPGEAALSLSVFEYPTSPSCAALKPEDGEEVAAVMEVTLECRGSTGTPPVSYSWQRTDGGEQPYICKSGSSVCERSVSPADRNSTYMCTARNPVGAEFCHVMVHAASRPEKHIERSTFTIVVTILAFLLMLAIVLAVTLWWRGGQAGKC